jgi:hypothetical protein
MRTARSITSGENFGDFLMMAPSSQTKEPPQIPGRFTGVSIAAVALANGLNANLLRRWVAHSEAQNAGRAVPGAAPVVAADGVVPFVPLTVRDDDGRGAERSIRIEVQRGAGRVQVHWPLAAAAECAAWLRGWLK